VSGPVQADRDKLLQLIAHGGVPPQVLEPSLVALETTPVRPEREEEHPREPLLTLTQLVIRARVGRCEDRIHLGSFGVVHVSERGQTAKEWGFIGAGLFGGKAGVPAQASPRAIGLRRNAVVRVEPQVPVSP